MASNLAFIITELVLTATKVGLETWENYQKVYGREPTPDELKAMVSDMQAKMRQNAERWQSFSRRNPELL